MKEFVVPVGFIVSCIILEVFTQNQIQDECAVEPPPVRNSYRFYSGSNFTYFCRGMEDVKQIRACASSYNVEDFRFCTDKCGNVFPLDSGATRAPVRNYVTPGSSVEIYTDYYECVKNFTAPTERLKSPYNQPICDRATQMYRRSPIGCYLQDVNFVSECVFVKGLSSSTKLTPSPGSPIWECKFNPYNKTEVTDIYISAVVAAANFTIVDENKEHLCGKLSSTKEMIVRNLNISCSMINELFPTGLMVRMYSDTPVNLQEVAVRGRSYILTCSSPPQIHGMTLELYLQTKANYKCLPNFQALRGSGLIYCNIDRVWTVPTLHCTDQIAVAGKYYMGISAINDNITDGNDRTCETIFACVNSNSQIIFINSTLEIETVVLTHKDKSFSKINSSVTIGNKNCVVPEIVDEQTTTFSFQTRPKSNQVTIHFTVPKEIDAKQSNTICTLCEIKVFGRESVGEDSNLECYRHPLGMDYKGKLNSTISGKTCQSWSNNYPHKHDYNKNEFFPDEKIISSSVNYCRYPVKENGTGNIKARRPWCFTTNSSVIFEECAVPMCHELCALRGDGADYAGYTDRTKNNQHCLNWPNGTKEDVNDHRDFTFWQDFPDWQTNIPSQHNYCRNPASSQSNPWCYFNKNGSSELCDIPACPTSKSISSTVNLTVAELQTKLESVNFTSSLVLLNGFQKWLPHTKDDLMSAQICPQLIEFLVAVIYDNSHKRYMSLSVDCTERSSISSTSETTTSFNTITRRNETTLDYISTDPNATEKYTSLFFNSTQENNLTETFFTSTERSPCDYLSYDKTVRSSDECYNSTLFSSVTKDDTRLSSTIESTASSVDTYKVTTVPIYTKQTSQFSTLITSPHIETTSKVYEDNSRLPSTHYSIEPTLASTNQGFSTSFTRSEISGLKYLNVTCFSMKNTKRCYCHCGCSNGHKHVGDEVIFKTNYDHDIKVLLKLDHSKVSRNVRKKQSAQDHRNSSVHAGIIAVTIIVTIVVGVVILDLRHFVASAIQSVKLRRLQQHSAESSPHVK